MDAVFAPPAALRTASRERLFRGSPVAQFRESAWPFAVALMLPALVAYVALVLELTGGRQPERWVGVILLLATVHLAFLLARGLARQRHGIARCAWIALGEGYVRLGMSFLRPRILLEQIVGVEGGDLSRGAWTSQAGGSRVRIRFVLPHSWEVMSVAYPVTIDPHGELASALQSAASRNRDKLGIREDASDETVSQAYRDLETAYRARQPAPAEPAIPELDETPP
jgi:hypothetical protein